MPLPSPALDDLHAAFGDRLLLDEPLARHTSARIGGPADAFLVARTADDLRQAARIAWAHALPLFILGGGSNILISDSGVRGLVVHNRTEHIAFDGPTVTAGSGVSTIQLARRLATRGLGGFEWAIGIPGTLGGAVYGNAGAHGGDMAGVVARVEAVTPAQGGRALRDVVWSNADLGFEYRSSILKRERRRCVILSVTLNLHPADPEAIRARMAEYTGARKRTQPPGATIGSMFKNPPGDYAGRLIDAAGLKGTRIGGAEISEVHANFFLNVGGATAGDVKALIDLARREVQARFGVWLELEVELVGEWRR
ncbi:MAG TPA: UDP-N-acetylmuramate dehydrogenase [Chloroflexi bacterium]|nr:UDP-N-acetylmuramate dehydrogenase [Chloroflexota bacterium]